MRNLTSVLGINSRSATSSGQHRLDGVDGIIATSSCPD
jgi:hypothetical protein